MGGVLFLRYLREVNECTQEESKSTKRCTCVGYDRMRHFHLLASD